MRITRTLLPDGDSVVQYSSVELETDLLQLRATASFAHDPEQARGFITMIVQEIAYNAGGIYRASALVFTEDQSLTVPEERLVQKFQYFERSVRQITDISIKARGKYWNGAITTWAQYDTTPLEALRHSIRQTKREEAKRKAEEERRAKSQPPEHYDEH